jgi:hypothetical protein
MAESQYPVPSCQNKSLAARTMSFTGYWVLGTWYFYLFFVHLPSMTGVQLVPSDDISNLNV